MKRFIIFVVLGYLTLVAFFFVTATLKGKNSHDKSKPSSEVKTQDQKALVSEPKAGGFAQKKSTGQLRADIEKEKIEKEKVKKEFKTFYSNGKISSLWRFVDGDLKGNSELFDRDGNVWVSFPFEENLFSGLFEMKTANGESWLSWGFQQGVLDGSFSFKYQASGSPLLLGKTEEGAFVNIPQLFSENGKENRAFYQMGTLASAGNAAGFKLYNDHGQIKAIGGQSHDGKVQKQLNTYYTNRQLSAEFMIQGNSLEGIQRLYSPQADLLMEIPFESHALTGELKFYNPQQQLIWSAEFSEGQKNGIELFFYADGSLWVELKWQAGVLLGLPKAYSEGKTFKVAS